LNPRSIQHSRAEIGGELHGVEGEKVGKLVHQVEGELVDDQDAR